MSVALCFVQDSNFVIEIPCLPHFWPQTVLIFLSFWLNSFLKFRIFFGLSKPLLRFMKFFLMLLLLAFTCIWVLQCLNYFCFSVHFYHLIGKVDSTPKGSFSGSKSLCVDPVSTESNVALIAPLKPAWQGMIQWL